MSGSRIPGNTTRVHRIDTEPTDVGEASEATGGVDVGNPGVTTATLPHTPTMWAN